MLKFSISKDLFDDILIKKTNILEKKNSNYWKKELLEPIIIEDKLSYKIRQIEKIVIVNGLGYDKPQMIVECKKVDYSIENGCFEFYLGKIIEQKNIINIKESDKDLLIKQLMEEKEKLIEELNFKNSFKI
ncbi:MAG: hypothetical protein KA055_00460 [Aliarcobacter sp.]|nr:hypothetical protein [Aliarcobacter sp.]